MTQDKHTALPWRVNTDMDGRHGHFAIMTEHESFKEEEWPYHPKIGEMYAGKRTVPREIAEANGKFLERAVNNHYQLIEALEYARRFLKPEHVDTAYIDQALSNAKGGIDPAA